VGNRGFKFFHNLVGKETAGSLAQRRNCRPSPVVRKRLQLL